MKITVCLSFTFLKLNRCTDLIEFWGGDTLIIQKGRRLLFTSITDINAGGTAGES